MSQMTMNMEPVTDGHDVIQEMLIELIKNKLNVYDADISLINQKGVLEGRNMQDSSECQNITDKDVSQEKNGIINIGIDLLNELRLLIWKSQHTLRRNENLRCTNMDEVILANTRSRSEDIHFLETILCLNYVLLQEQKVMQIENINKKTRYTFYNSVQPYLQNGIIRDKSVISEMVSELLGKFNSRRLVSKAPPHIHIFNMDKDDNDAEENYSGSYEWKDTKEGGNYRSEILQKLNDDICMKHMCLLAYLIKHIQSKMKESTGCFPLSLIINIFMSEFSLEWKKARNVPSEMFTYNGDKSCQLVEMEDKLPQYYPLCHFCSKKLDLDSHVKYCCVNMEVIDLIKKKMQNIRGFRTFASLSQATLRNVAEKVEKYRMENLADIIKSFLKGTAHKTHLSHGEITKLSMAVAAIHQYKQKMLGNDCCKTLIDNPTELIVDSNIESLLNEIRQYINANNQPPYVYKIEYLMTNSRIHPSDKKEKKIHRKEVTSNISSNENKNIFYENSKENKEYNHECLNSKRVKYTEELITRKLRDDMISSKISKDRKDEICDNCSNIIENDSGIIEKDSRSNLRINYSEKAENIQRDAPLGEIINGQTDVGKAVEHHEIECKKNWYASLSSENEEAIGTKNFFCFEDTGKGKENLEKKSINQIKNYKQIETGCHGNNNSYKTESKNNKFPLNENNKKRQKGHEKEELYSIYNKTEADNSGFRKREAITNNEKDKAEKKSKKNKIVLEDTQTKMSKTSTEVTKKKSKSLASSKNSKSTIESKSVHTPSASSGKQSRKGGVKVFGFIPYRLSDPKYIECGWSKIPKQYHMKKVAIFGVTQGKKNMYWCKSGVEQEVYAYPEGSVFSILREDGSGEIFYQDGQPAILVTRENNRIVTTVFSEGKANLLSLRVVGRFDSYGHGIIYDDDGKVRLQYTQTWGRVIDPITGRFMKWYWKIALKGNGNVNVNGKSPKARKISAEYKKENLLCLGEEPKDLRRSVLCPIPFFTMKLNDAISFRLFEQHDMCLVFYANKTCFRLEIGVAVDSSKEEFYELCIDHEKEKGVEITKNIRSIHDELLPPSPELPRNLSRAPIEVHPTEERKAKPLFLHRAINVEGIEIKKSLT